MNRPNERRAQPVKRSRAGPLFDAGGDPGLQFLGSSFGECECDNACRVRAARHEFGETLGDHFGLAGTRRRNDLEMRSAVAYRRQCVAREKGRGHIRETRDSGRSNTLSGKSQLGRSGTDMPVIVSAAFRHTRHLAQVFPTFQTWRL